MESGTRTQTRLAEALTPEAREAFGRDGVVVLDRVIDADTLEGLRAACGDFVAATDARLDAAGVTTQGITHRGSRYFVSGRYRESEYLPSFLFGELMASIVATLLGDDAFLFVEQWVVKGPRQGMRFAWHQDAGYVSTYDPGNVPPRYITCWCALDDMTVENGTLYVLPHDRAGTRERVLPHEREEGSNDLVGYQGEDPGDLVECRAGSIVVFTGTSLHRSVENRSDSWRRAYLAQYSVEPVLHSQGGPWAQAVPFLSAGRRVYDPATDTAARWTRAARWRNSIE